MISYLTINHSNVFYVGDIQGQYSDLMRCLDTLAFNPEKDLLISCGDMIDRGAESLQCLSLIEQPWFTTVIANHELMAIHAKSEGFDGPAHTRWLANGGGWFESLSLSQKGRVAELLDMLVKDYRPCMEVSIKPLNQVVGVVHAGIPAGFTWSMLKEATLSNDELHRYITTRVYKQAEIDGAFNTNPEELDMIVVGHNVISNEAPYVRGKIVFSDTGSCKGGKVLVSSHDVLMARVLELGHEGIDIPTLGL